MPNKVFIKFFYKFDEVKHLLKNKTQHITQSITKYVQITQNSAAALAVRWNDWLALFLFTALLKTYLLSGQYLQRSF